MEGSSHPDEAAADPIEQEAVLRGACDEANRHLDAMRSELAAARHAIDALDAIVSKLRARRAAAEASLRGTARAAAGSGLLESASVRLSLSRHQAVIDATRLDIRRLVQVSSPACEEYIRAAAEVRAARHAAIDALGALVAFRVATSRPNTQAKRSDEASQLFEKLRKQREIELEDRIARHLPDEAHFDPRWDEWELWQRRHRPWV